LKRIIVPVILLILIGLQNSLFEFVKILGMKPDIVITFVICFTLIRGNPEGTIVGIAGGILEDVFFGYTFGINSIACMLTAYLIGTIENKLYKDNIFIPAIFVFTGSLIKELIVYLFLYLTRSSFGIVYAFNNVILREAIYNTILGAIFFRYIVKMNNKYLPEQNWRF
jgi:rod shape-determining protein MreD